VVDNASTDATPELLASLGGDVLAVRYPTNLGFARGCNQGAALARGDVIVFLNNDVEAGADYFVTPAELAQRR
jgi:GT2 family glycosyltransferase